MNEPTNEEWKENEREVVQSAVLMAAFLLSLLLLTASFFIAFYLSLFDANILFVDVFIRQDSQLQYDRRRKYYFESKRPPPFDVWKKKRI